MYQRSERYRYENSFTNKCLRYITVFRAISLLGTSVQYTNWVPGHTANYVSSSQEDCVVLIPYKDGQWDDIPCGHTSHPLFGHTTSSGETHPLLCEYGMYTWFCCLS